MGSLCFFGWQRFAEEQTRSFERRSAMCKLVDCLDVEIAQDLRICEERQVEVGERI